MAMSKTIIILTFGTLVLIIVGAQMMSMHTLPSISTPVENSAAKNS
jgi:hypothetical protein